MAEALVSVEAAREAAEAEAEALRARLADAELQAAQVGVLHPSAWHAPYQLVLAPSSHVRSCAATRGQQ